MHFCLLQHSPEINHAERKEIDDNQNLVAHQGRAVGLTLQQRGHKISLKDSANPMLDAMHAVAVLLDQAHYSQHYQAAVKKYKTFIAHADLTPSAPCINRNSAK